MTRFGFPLPAAIAVLLLTAPVHWSQSQVVPTTPRSFEQRNPGNRPAPRALDIGPGDIGRGVGQQQPRDQTTVRTVSYIALGPDREWTSADGQVMTAKVIAWQDSVEQTVTQGRPTEEQTTPRADASQIPSDFVPIVLNDNQVRILRGRDVFALPLDRLSEEDQAYVRQLDEAVRATAARRAEAQRAAQPTAAPRQEDAGAAGEER